MRQRRIDPTSHTPLYHQLADLLRAAIQSGEYEPGFLLPTELALEQEFEVGRDTVRDAMAVLRREGLVVTRHGQGSRVAERPEPTVITLGPDVDVTTRMPTEDERRRKGLDEGTPVFVISRPGEPDEIVRGGPYTIIRTSGGSESEPGTESRPEDTHEA